MGFRIGTGYDAHRLAADRPLIIGGATIPHDKGLLGHSDADVLVHALMDALLGAAALGDIGVHFPDTDSRYKGISGLEMLEEVPVILTRSGYSVVKTDSVVIAQKPKLRPYIQQMIENVSGCLGIKCSQVSIKATTEEGLGFTGSCEGISAQAVCLLED